VGPKKLEAYEFAAKAERRNSASKAGSTDPFFNVPPPLYWLPHEMPVGLHLLLDYFQSSPFYQIPVQCFRSGYAVIILIDYKPFLHMILFQHDDSIFIKGVFGPLEKLHCVFVSQVRKDPLNPDDVVLLCESEVLQS
jgi:hypothetical protein